MVNKQIINMEAFNNLQRRLKGIHKHHFEQFVVSVLSWYQMEVTTPPNKWNTFEGRVLQDHYPPNLFDIFEYPNLDSDTIINQFILSDTLFRQEEYPELDFEEAKSNAIFAFNQIYHDILDHMLDDISLVLNEYRLFHCYLDDANFKGNFINQPFVEVW